MLDYSPRLIFIHCPRNRKQESNEVVEMRKNNTIQADIIRGREKMKERDKAMFVAAVYFDQSQHWTDFSSLERVRRTDRIEDGC